jgi:alpha-mannosidase
MIAGWVVHDGGLLIVFSDFFQEAHTATQLANEIVNTFVQGDQESIKKCRQIAAKYLGDKVSSSEVYKSDKTPLVFGTGHCHIDTAWLWPFDETKRLLLNCCVMKYH